jgi:prefoldin subunit 5
MAASPEWKVYNAAGEYKACCKDIEDAAALVALYGNGACIKNPWRKPGKLWVEGSEEVSAAESYDQVAHTVHKRCDDYTAEIEAKRKAVTSARAHQ